MNTQAQKKLQQLREENVQRVKIAFTDIDGVQRGKYLSMDKFSSVLEGGGGSVTLYSAGILTTSCTTTPRLPAGTRASPTPAIGLI